MSTIQIPRCYDSHTHLLATGQMAATLSLHGLSNRSQLPSLPVERLHFRGDWLVAFGWDQHRFAGHQFPDRTWLDEVFPNHPVSFSRVDGHALWVNSEALKRCGLWRPVREWNLPPGGEAHADADGFPTGVLLDRAMDFVFAKIPADTLSQKKEFLLGGARVFNQAGFTHLRDMSGDASQWRALRELDQEGRWTLYLDQNFSFERPEDFTSALDCCREFASEKNPHLRVRGVKFYLDGALGSEGAALSRPYGGTRGSGFCLWEPEQMREWIDQTWSEGFEVSVHVIGDAASDRLVSVADSLWQQGRTGFLNLEHAEVLRAETIEKLRGRPVRVHMQPCHWLTDRAWLTEKLGPLSEHAFLWRLLDQTGVALSWGSDAPIEAPSLSSNEEALRESPSKIPSYLKNWWEPHVHPDQQWGKSCWTEWERGRVTRVVFDERNLI